MRLHLHPVALSLTAALVAGCSGPSPGATAPGAGPVPAVRAATGTALLYVSEFSANRVDMYSYPSLKLRGQILHVHRPVGMCVDPTTQAVWVIESDFANRAMEFAHGGTSPIRTLRLEKALYPNSCAVDPNSGALAVVSLNDNDDPGELDVFAPGSRTPTVYQNRQMFYYDFAGYDDRGNVFVDGYGTGFKLAKLSPGGKQLKIVPAILPRIPHPGNVQFDGTNLAVGNQRHGIVYRLSGTTLVGTTLLRGTCQVHQFFIDGGRIIVPNTCRSKGDIRVYDYPAGGAPIATIAGLGYPFGAAISR